MKNIFNIILLTILLTACTKEDAASSKTPVTQESKKLSEEFNNNSKDQKEKVQSIKNLIAQSTNYKCEGENYVGFTKNNKIIFFANESDDQLFLITFKKVDNFKKNQEIYAWDEGEGRTAFSYEINIAPNAQNLTLYVKRRLGNAGDDLRKIECNSIPGPIF